MTAYLCILIFIMNSYSGFISNCIYEVYPMCILKEKTQSKKTSEIQIIQRVNWWLLLC